jgi:hypothetical protein
MWVRIFGTHRENNLGAPKLSCVTHRPQSQTIYKRKLQLLLSWPEIRNVACVCGLNREKCIPWAHPFPYTRLCTYGKSVREYFPVQSTTTDAFPYTRLCTCWKPTRISVQPIMYMRETYTHSRTPDYVPAGNRCGNTSLCRVPLHTHSRTAA